MAFGFFARRRSFLWPRPGTFRGLAAASINLKAFLEGPCRSQWLLVNEPGEGPLAERTAQEVRKSLHGLEVSALAVVDLAPHSGAANFEVLLERFQVALTQAAVEVFAQQQVTAHVAQRFAEQLFRLMHGSGQKMLEWYSGGTPSGDSARRLADGASALRGRRLTATGRLRVARLPIEGYGVLANVCAKSSQWQQALLCLHHMLHQSLQSDTVVFNAAISSCEKAQQWPNALALLQLMSEMRYEADLISQNAALAALGSAGEWLQALQQFEDLPSVHLEGNDVTYSSTMNAVARVGLWRTAEQLWSNLEVQNLEQSVVACNVAITACERGNQWTEALGFLQKIWENSLEPTVVTVGACTSACEASWRTALALPFDMNIVALNAVISACGKDGQWDIALRRSWKGCSVRSDALWGRPKGRRRF
ncbi:Pentatricopeptide repeat-containing protein At2g31400 [Durusdinium trenchii]|uniref:Chloroplastic n=1 Tax=Durusdinium trenchii TaxID=1381693 RepID=A0ABP0RTS6_9DINO